MLESICSKHWESCIYRHNPFPVNFRSDFKLEYIWHGKCILTMRLNLVLLVRLKLYATTLVLHWYTSGTIPVIILPLRLVISVSVLVMVSFAAARSCLAWSFSVASAALSFSNAEFLSFSAARSSAKFLFCDERASFAKKNH